MASEETKDEKSIIMGIAWVIAHWKTLVALSVFIGGGYLLVDEVHDNTDKVDDIKSV
jgi:hypothetical protein